MRLARPLIVLFVIALMVAAFTLPVADTVVSSAETIRAAGAIRVVVFIATYVLSTVLFLPGSLLTLVAGFAYGPVIGMMVAAPAAVLGASTAFLLGRTLLREWVKARVAQSPRAAAIDAAVGREGFKLVLLLRLSPLVPFNVLNYALSLSRVTFGRYVLASAIGMLPGTALYVYLGSLVPAAAELSTASGRGGPFTTGLYVVGLVTTLAAVIISTRLARRTLQSELAVNAGEGAG